MGYNNMSLFNNNTKEQQYNTMNIKEYTYNKEYSFKDVNNYCNNCSKLGHTFSQCKHPITSIGLIVFRKINGELQYLMIRRKDSLGFVDFMRGKYPLYNKLYLQNIFAEMTNNEKKNLLTKDFSILWNELWGEYVGIQYRGEEKISLEKYEQLKSGINVTINFLGAENKYSIKTLVEETKENWSEPEWGFPKGRHNHQEKDLYCALREFEEETGYSRANIKIVQNVIPFEEIFTGSNYKSYKHKYYLAYMDDNKDSLQGYQTTEVSKMDWKNIDEAVKCIRPYNLEKIDVITRVNKLLSDYKLYP